MADSDSNPKNSDPEMQRPPDERPPGNGNGNGNGHPRPLRITSVSPIGGALAGGFDATITGSGFDPDIEVFFGSNQSPEVHFLSLTQLTAKVPAAAQTGSVDVKVVNPDGAVFTKPGAFTYVTNEASLHAEVLGVEPLAVIEDTESEVTIRGRNLIAAYNDGFIALRGTDRVHITFSNFGSSTDEATGIDLLTLTVRVVATPPLEQQERMAIQVLASLRPGAANDGVVDSSRQMFTVLPRAVPVVIAFSANLDPTRPNLVMIAGRNLEGCALNLGQGAMVHVQKSDDQTVAAIVSFPDGAQIPASAQLTLVDSAGNEAGQFAMTVSATAESSFAKSSTGETAAGDSTSSGNNEIGLTLTEVPGQQIIGPTAENSALFNLRGPVVPNFFFNFGDFEFTILERHITIPLFNEVRLIPFFDNGEGDVLNNSPIVAEVGKLFRLRGMGLLVALHVDLVIVFEIVLIIGFRFNWGFDLFNEFWGDYPWAIGSIVFRIRVVIDVFFLINFLIALVKPGGEMRVLFYYNLVLGVHFTISSDGRELRFGTRFIHTVNHTRIGPHRTTLLPCDGRFQLAEENGQTEFVDSFGATQSFYFPRAAGPCCVPWDFQLELVRSEEGGQQQVVQASFRTEFCLNALAPRAPHLVIITSDPPPTGVPATLEMNIGDFATLKALGQPVDSDGNPVPGPLKDLKLMGFTVKFYLQFTPTVLNPTLLPDGEARAELPGGNLIRAAVTSPPRIIDVDTGEEIPFSFWPGGVVGFDILSFLAQGLLPAIRAGGLPVQVNAPAAGELTVTPTLAYLDNSSPPKLVPASTLERNEPFETQRDYVLAAMMLWAVVLTRTRN